MKIEKTKVNFIAIISPPIIDIFFLFNLSSSLYFKFFILLFSLFCFSGFKQTDSNPTNQLLAEVEAIAKIPDPNARALFWYIHVYKTVLINPKEVGTKLATAKTLWADNFVHKEAILLLTKAEIAGVQGEYDHTNSNVLKAIKLLKSSKFKNLNKEKILCLAHLAFANHSRYTKEKDGLKYAFKGLSIATDINFISGLVFAHNKIGLMILAAKNDHPTALDHFMEAQALLPKLPPKTREFMSAFIIGNIIATSTGFDEIERKIDYKLQILERDNINLDLLLVTNKNLGVDYYELKQYDLAEKHFQKALDLMTKYEDYVDRGIPLLRLGILQFEKGNINKASEYANAIDSWLIKYKFHGNYKVMFYQFKSKIAKANNDHKQAIIWIEKAFAEQNSLDKAGGFNNLVTLEKGSKLREIEQEQLILEKELDLKRIIINSQNIVLLAISFITILSLWFSISFYNKTRELKDAYNFILQRNSSSSSEQKKTTKKINEVLKQKILHALAIEKVFLDPDLTLKKFADQLASNTSYVSQTINEGCGKNFSTLINEYRIKEVLHFFGEGQHKQFTIEALYQKAGFKSKSAFQKAFKSNQGVTASHFLEHISNPLEGE